MARLSIGEKAARALQFLMGLREPLISNALAAYGFNEAERQEGYARLRALTDDRLALLTPLRDASALQRLDEWENLWFPIADACLRARFPAIHESVFRNLRQAKGEEVVISVGTLLDRLATLSSGAVANGADALALLAVRGLDAARLDEGRALLVAAQSLAQASTAPTIDPATIEAREAALWAWYLEWSQIARAAIHDRRHLRMLGFGRRSSAEEEAEVPAPPSMPAPAVTSV